MPARLFAHGLLDKTDNRQQDSAANAAAGDAAHNAADIHPAAAGGYAQKTEQLTANPSAENPGDGIAQRPQGYFRI